MVITRLLLFVLQILHHHIASVEKLSLTTTGCPLVIHCRNFRVVNFVLQRERDCHDIFSSLLRLLRPGAIRRLFVLLTDHKAESIAHVVYTHVPFCL